MTIKHLEHHISQTNKGFHPILVTYVFGFVVLTSLWDQRSKVKVIAGSDRRNWVNTISSLIFEIISPKLGHVCICVWDILFRPKVQGHSRRKRKRERQPVEFHLVWISYIGTLTPTGVEFEHFYTRYYTHLQTYWWRNCLVTI